MIKLAEVPGVLVERAASIPVFEPLVGFSFFGTILYVSIPYATAVHNCFCGCGTKVVTPISPVGWQLTYDGEAVTLWPSVGNWAFPCRSHYFIKHGAVVWAGDMSEDEVARGRSRDKAARETHFDGRPGAAPEVKPQTGAPQRKKSLWSWLSGGLTSATAIPILIFSQRRLASALSGCGKEVKANGDQ